MEYEKLVLRGENITYKKTQVDEKGHDFMPKDIREKYPELFKYELYEAPRSVLYP